MTTRRYWTIVGGAWAACTGATGVITGLQGTTAPTTHLLGAVSGLIGWFGGHMIATAVEKREI